MAVEVLSQRALNRATLARQMLLERVRMTPYHAVRHLVGLQAQTPQEAAIRVEADAMLHFSVPDAKVHSVELAGHARPGRVVAVDRRR